MKKPRVDPPLEILIRLAHDAGGVLKVLPPLAFRTVGEGCGKSFTPLLQVGQDHPLMLPSSTEVPCGWVLQSGDFSQIALCDTCRKHRSARDEALVSSGFVEAWMAASTVRFRMEQEKDAGTPAWHRRMNLACAAEIRRVLTASLIDAR